MSAEHRTAEDVFKDLIMCQLEQAALFATLAAQIEDMDGNYGNALALASLGERVARRLSDVAESASDGDYDEAKL